MALTRPNYNNLNSNVEVFNDPITVLNGGSTTDDDVGFLVNRANGLLPNVAIYWNEATNSFVTALTPDTGGPNANISIDSYANITTGNVYAEGIYWRANGTPFTSSLSYGNTEVAAYLLNSNAIHIVDGTQATTANTGAFQVWGGASIGANLYVGGNLIIAGNAYTLETQILSQTEVQAVNIYGTNYFYSNGTPFNYGNVQVAAYLGEFTGNITAGNVSVIKDLHAGQDITAVRDVQIGRDVTIGGNLTVQGITTIVNTEIVTSTEIVGGNLVANSGTASTSTTSGALVVAGGVGVSGNVFIGGNLDVDGTLTQNVTIPASANQIYVAKNGSDSNNGSLNQPFLTIKAALTAATSGTSVQIAPGSYTENNPVTIPAGVSLMGDNLRSVTVIPQNPNSDLFYVTNGCYVWGITIRNYNANGFAYSSSTSSQNVFVSPYIQNLTSTTTTAGATAVMIDGNYSSAISTKAMIVGFFTIINRGGVGIHITNSGYSQLVNIYTIAANVGVWCESGAFCTLNGSDNSIGNVGLRADGTGPLLSYGLTSEAATGGVFKIQNPSAPPNVNQTLVINGDPTYYTIDTIRKLDGITYQVTIQEIYPTTLSIGSNILFYQRSAVVASAHTFEYVGAGTNPATALPQYGGYPDANLNVITTGGGRITYTATDEKGNFFIGSNLVINQSTGTITGDSFSKSMFTLMTPYILALAEGP
jgi:hypothetical protein